MTDPPPALAPDMTRTLHSWWDVLSASGTATARELAIWIDALVGCDSWIDRDDESVIVAIGTRGTGNSYPCTLDDMREAAEDLMEEAEEDEDEDADEEDDLSGFNRAPIKGTARYAG